MTGLAGIPANRREGIDRGDQSIIRFQCIERSIAAFTGYKEIDKACINPFIHALSFAAETSDRGR